MTTGFTSVDEYIAAQPKHLRLVLERVRRTIRQAVPGAEESISYQIPTFRLNGRVLIYFAAWKEHYSVYPSNERLVAAFKTDLARYELSKGTIRFPPDEPVPVRLIGGIAKFLAREAAERATARTLAKEASKKRRGQPARVKPGASRKS
jgi:uncharacterized protein YdhG (YjbR/CyaY superfamily)